MSKRRKPSRRSASYPGIRVNRKRKRTFKTVNAKSYMQHFDAFVRQGQKVMFAGKEWDILWLN